MEYEDVDCQTSSRPTQAQKLLQQVQCLYSLQVRTAVYHSLRCLWSKCQMCQGWLLKSQSHHQHGSLSVSDAKHIGAELLEAV